jgi:putative addiction module killer protein
MLEIRQTSAFKAWFVSLRDKQAAKRIQARIDRLALGNPGDVEPVGMGVSELRIDYGPGFRVYFVSRGRVLVILLCGGDKRNQDRDIKHAIAMAGELED